MIKSKAFRRYQIVINLILILVTIIMIVPLVLVLSSSLTSEASLIKNGYNLWPKEFSLEAYKYIFRNKETIFRAYGLTILTTAAGTVTHLLLALMAAYALSFRKLPFRNIINFYIFFTMLFSGGLVPSYIMWTQTFHIKNTLFAYIVPGLMLSAMNIILIRSFFMNSIPEALYEAAEIDGAGYFRMFWNISIPLGKPILVTVALFVGLSYWNSWINGLYYINKGKLFTIQVLLNKMISDIQALQADASASANVVEMPQIGIRMAIAFVAFLPILCVYPFLQKYFAKGIAIGAVKG